MTSASLLLRSLIIYGLCLPLAVFLGYLLASPPDMGTLIFVGVLLFILMLPMFLRWHHPWLIASWNMFAVVFFLPGRPAIWMALTAVTLLISGVQYALRRERTFLYVPSLTKPLILLAVVTLVTAELTGGIGIRSFGSAVVGGKRYVYILGAIAGFFAISSRPIPRRQAALYVSLFFLGGATLALGDLAGHIHPAFNFIFLIFPVENIMSLSNDVTAQVGVLTRSGGLNTLGLGLFSALLARYGLRAMFTLQSPFKLLLLLTVMFIGLMGGYRSLLVQFLITLAILFWLEGLFRSRMLPMLVLCSIATVFLLGAFATSLPFSVQRTLAVLPINIDPEVKMDTDFSSEWRLRMWREVVPEIPRYLLLGKGYALSGRDLEMIGLNTRQGHEGSEFAGDYHNGPLSVILPLGIFGVIAFGWLIVAGIRVVHRNFKYGDPSLHAANTFLFGFFLAKVVYFLTVFGALDTDLPLFTGILALSVSLNRGVAKAALAEPRPEPAVAPPTSGSGVRAPGFRRLRIPMNSDTQSEIVGH